MASITITLSRKMLDEAVERDGGLVMLMKKTAQRLKVPVTSVKVLR